MAEKLPVLSEEFRDFLIEAKSHGYGSDSAERITRSSGAVEISYQDGDWLYTDSFVGGTPFTGYEHVSARDPRYEETWLPIWGMNYLGGITNSRLSAAVLSELLGQVLTKPNVHFPIRGPIGHFFQNEWGRYELRQKGSLEEFSATETIGRSTQNVFYRARLLGGLINRNRGLEASGQIWLAK